MDYDIKQHEGCVLGSYQDIGQMATGYGHRLAPGERPARTRAEADMYYAIDIARCEAECAQIFGKTEAQAAVVLMLYQLGRPRFMGFQRFIAAVRARDWSAARREAADSKWGKKYPKRLDAVLRALPQ